MPPVRSAKPTIPPSSMTETTQAIEGVRGMIASLPQHYRGTFATMLRAVADEVDPPSKGHAVEADDGETAVEKLRQFFQDRDNHPATIAEMSKGADVSYLSLRGLIYKRHRDKFTPVPAESGKAGSWRWTDLLTDTQKRRPIPLKKPALPVPKNTTEEDS